MDARLRWAGVHNNTQSKREYKRRHKDTAGHKSRVFTFQLLAARIWQRLGRAVRLIGWYVTATLRCLAVTRRPTRGAWRATATGGSASVKTAPPFLGSVGKLSRAVYNIRTVSVSIAIMH